jgi:dipeptidyl aminopeptidase/acylaminoacyl peptidase
MEPIQASDYHEITQVAAPQLSPDGETVAFVRKEPTDEESYGTEIWTVPADGSADAEPFTSGESDSEPRFSPSGDRIAFRRSEDDDPSQLYVVPTDGGEARQVTDVIGGVDSLSWSPDGETIAFTQRTTAEERREGNDLRADEDSERETPDPRVIDRLIYRADQRYFDGMRSHVYTVELAEDPTESAVERHTEGDLDFVAPAFGDETTLYYAVKRGEDPDDHIEYDVDALDLETRDRETITSTHAWEPQLEATGDGRIAYPYTEPDRPTLRQTEIEVFDRETGEAVRPTAGIDRTAESFVVDGDHLVFSTPDEGDVAIRRTPLADTGRDAVETIVDSGHATALDATRGRVVVTKSEWKHRGDVFLVDTTEDGSEGRRLTNVNSEYLDEHRVGEPEEIRFESEEGVEIQGWVLHPPDFDPEETYPLAVEIHGGPHAMWSTAGTMWHEFQTLAARGYVVFWSNPRGSSGYGEAFTSAIAGEWGSVTATDVLAGVEAVGERDYVDTDDQFVTGGSFGGFMTGWLVGHTDRFSGAVAQRGVYELNSFYGSTDAFHLVEWDFDTTPWESPEYLWEQSPAAHVEDIETPTLVVHADDDFRVPVNNGELFYLFLRKQGVDTRLVRYPREGHELSRSGEPRHVVDRLERIARWFDGYSEHHDAPSALERGSEGLSNGESDDRP